MRTSRSKSKIKPEQKHLAVWKGENAYKLYPNPNNGTMQLEYRIQEGEVGEFVLFDLTGRLINNYKLYSNNTILYINEQELKNAVYFYTINVNGLTAKTGKLVIIK